MSGFCFTDLVNIGNTLHSALSVEFPSNTWVVLPEVAGNQQSAGFIIQTRVVNEISGNAHNVVSRPRVLLENIEDLSHSDFRESVLAAFELQLTGENVRFKNTRVKSWVLADNAVCPIEIQTVSKV